MNHGGVKNVVTEPTRIENKQSHSRYCLPTVASIRQKRREMKGERRRGAAGRAAALRRAPSDSDCSGETASLSADSGDRAPRPPPQPLRSGKTRSRRRGSEWEVLEGLKDGQRFEKRPDVFNGYLHKKRKWPLKGWHKRFFVVDGGILVYARSPTDVARGRLHGSVDVGLSVISAKARRRRIDIDADEFIYHLRAKTPEVFRTWLNVLKTHRLYRQHLLTFGARESVPKIHAPLEDLPPTDTSSRTSYHSSESSSIDEKDNLICRYVASSDHSLSGSQTNLDNRNNPGTANACDNNSLCSMNCVSRRMNKRDIERRKPPKILPQKSVNISLGSTLAESQLHSTDLDVSSLKTNNLSPSGRIQESSPASKDSAKSMIASTNIFGENKVNETQAYYFFTRKRSRGLSPLNNMRRSKKSTNLVKYRNVYEEPTLKKPINKCMLLGKRAVTYHHPVINHEVACSTDFENDSNEIHVAVCTQHKNNKSYQEAMKAPDYDDVTQRLIMTLMKSRSRNYQAEEYMRVVIRDLYDSRLDHDHPIKQIFRSLLEYWLKNTSVDSVRTNMKRTQSISRQSNEYFTKDQIISNTLIDTATTATQFHGMSDAFKEKAPILKKPVSKMTRRDQKQCPVDSPSPRRDTESFEKERRIQELETLLKNTVYIVETTANAPSKEKDIRITKTLIDNIGKNSRRAKEPHIEISNSSTEKLKDTINHLISETSVSVDVAKGLLSVYLDVLLHGDNSLTNTSSQTSSTASKFEPECEVQAEPVVKKVSKSVTNLKTESMKPNENVDSGQVYLKDILDKVTTIFSRSKKMNAKSWESDKSQIDSQDGHETNEKQESELGMPLKDFFGTKIIYENIDEKSIVIDLSKYNLEHISMVSDPSVKGLMSITIKLKEKPHETGESNRKSLKLELSESRRLDNDAMNDKYLTYIPTNTTNSNVFFNNEPKRKSLLEFPKNFDLKPYVSSSFKTNDNSNRVSQESDPSLGLSFDSSNAFHKEYFENEEHQSCYIMSLKKDPLGFQSRKKEKENNGKVMNSKIDLNHISPTFVFDKQAQKVIDEKFIILLLENLTLLSKNVPTLHKDINSLYLKLKKKHDKVVKACGNNQGLSFLGKIYHEESCTSNIKEVATQYDANDPSKNNEGDTRDETTNTVTVVFADSKRVLDKRLSAVDLKKILHSTSQTLDVFEKTDSEIIPKNFKNQATYSFEPNTHIEEGERALPKQNRFKLISCPERTAFKRAWDHDTTHNHLKTDDGNIKKKKLVWKVNNKVKEIRVLPPLLKVSNQSQTEQVYERYPKVTRRKLENDFNVYYLYVSNRFVHAKSSSMSESNFDARISDDLKTLYRCTSEPSLYSGLLSPTAAPIRGPQAGFVSGTPGGRLAGWIIESGGPLENASRELGQAQLSVQQLQRLLDALELQQQLHHDTDVSLEGASPNVKKDRRKFGLRKKKSNSKCASVELQPPHIDPSSSHMALSALTAPPSPGGGASSMPNSAASLPIACAAARPQSLPGAETLGTAPGPASLTSLTPDHQLREDFTVLAKDLVASLKTIVSTLICERGRLRAAMDASDTATSPSGAVMAALRTNLNTALHQNSELRTRLSRIHDASDLAEISSVGPNSDPVNSRPFQQSLSYSSSCVSASEFFDAEEHDDDLKATDIIAADEAGVIELDGDSSSEAGSLSSEEGSASSDNSDGAISAEQVTMREGGAECGAGWSRRTRLPAPRPTPGGPSLWNLLYKNIGKDLSQISMPVTINEPLNMLQRLCEELEYSELLDLAAECSGAVERMALIAAFAVSAYSATAHRAASKPFNPLLAETYECVRDDKGFRFIAEQVSHHPPISACHADSSRWSFWQEARIKTKFWGKSMEFQPAGRVHVKLLSTGDHYSWNKVTTCVHNLFGGQRWVDQYGDMHITCHGTEITCKLNFIKASSWSSSRHEVRGAVSVSGSARLRLSGRWSEALYAGDPPAARCLWRPGAMPPEHDLYYGFTRFAMELNELEPGMREALPHTDTRLRPDQRALEEGDVEAAEQLKHQLEQAQRDRRRDSANHIPAWFRKTLESGEEMWVFSGEYWKAREVGFSDNLAPAIW